ncbi:hypothetical protein CDO52_15935 [Nocardiopsis gilva YIM 90087]|uniref:Uncharacterized protein n=1 Tax=Nocardiopsis gilva YIM 90087 TaxID=1235441 RepID=A0A223S7I7_9ACTN|nr:hypothetical protein CDO52_15935 [Nocardiopsis gilva YIM 90087]
MLLGELVDLGGQPARGASECFRSIRFVPRRVPFFAAPAAWEWARTLVESMRCQVPSRHQRRWRPAAVSQGL